MFYCSIQIIQHSYLKYTAVNIYDKKYLLVSNYFYFFKLDFQES